MFSQQSAKASACTLLAQSFLRRKLSHNWLLATPFAIWAQYFRLSLTDLLYCGTVL